MRRIQGWDPLLIISQIISLQTIHYLVLSILIPPILQHTTDPQALTYAGGPRVTGYVLDWREIASRSTAPRLPRHPPGGLYAGGGGGIRRRNQQSRGSLVKSSGLDEAASDPRHTTNETTLYIPSQFTSLHRRLHDPYDETIVPSHYAVTNENDDHYEVWDYGVSKTRGWVLAAVWVLVSVFDIIPLYYLVRKPTLILDFACTLVFIHVLVSTYHTGGRFPTNFFFWAVMATGTVLMIIGAEQLCVRREMKEGLGNVMDPDLERLTEAEAYELDER